MLKRITFLKDYRCFKAGAVLDFEPLTLLVGDQGCGKSTILQLLGNAGSARTKEIIRIEANKISTRWFDYEKHNPRFGKPIETIQDVAIMKASHGQFTRRLNDSMCDESGVCWLQDEPDSALSIRSCYRLAEQMKTALKNGCQLIAAVHSPIVISQFERVLSLEHRKWMSAKDFIASHSPAPVENASRK